MKEKELLQMPGAESQEKKVEDVFEKRKEIVEALVNKMEKNPQVIAAFLAGADANDSVDEYSDIDFDIVVTDDESIEEVEKEVRVALEQFSPIKTELTFFGGNNKTIIHQFENLSKYLHVDVLYLTNADSINKSDVTVLFDKQGVIKEIEVSEKELKEEIMNKVRALEELRGLREAMVERELNRGHFLEAEDKYKFVILKKLVEALRLQYCPEKSGHDMKHIYDDLPEEAVTELEDLSKISSMDELKEKYARANQLLDKTLEKLKA